MEPGCLAVLGDFILVYIAHGKVKIFQCSGVKMQLLEWEVTSICQAS